MASLVAAAWLVPEAAAAECPVRIQQVQTAIEPAERLLQDKKVRRSELESRLARASKLSAAAARHHAEDEHDQVIAKANIAVTFPPAPTPAVGGDTEIPEGQ